MDHSKKCCDVSFQSAELKGLIADVTCINPEDVNTARTRTHVLLLLYDQQGNLLQAVTRKSSSAFEGTVTASFPGATPSLDVDDDSSTRIARIRLVTTPPTMFAYALLVIIQKPAARLLGQTELTIPTLKTVLQGEVPAHLVGLPQEAHTAQVVLGTFEGDHWGHTDTANYKNGITEVVAVFYPISDSTPQRWALLPVRDITPIEPTSLTSPTSFKKLAETSANTVLRQIFHTSGSPPYGAPLILDEVLGELLDLRGKPVRGPNVDVEVPDTSTKRSAATEAFGSCYPTAQQTKAPESSVPKSVAVSDILTELKQKSTQLRERERRVANEMETVIHLLKKHESPNFKAMSERIYAEPWRRPRSSHKDSNSSSSSEASSARRSAALGQALEKFRRTMREELFEALENYATRDSVQPVQPCVDFSSRQFALLKRELQLIRQRQNELDAALTDLATAYTSNQETDRDAKFSYQESSTASETTLPSHKDPLVAEFIAFTRSLEKVTQITGASFRRLQRVLHYPEAFRDLAQGTSYPCARKLLEFVSSKKATALVEDIETLGSMWRSAGARIPSDPMSLGAFNLTDIHRKRWWTLRPFDYAS